MIRFVVSGVIIWTSLCAFAKHVEPSSIAAVMTAADDQIRFLNQRLYSEKWAAGKLQLQSQFRNSDGPVCPPQPPTPPVKPTCVLDCISRFADGSCASYGRDYCAPNAICAKDCNSRFADGSCATYGPDFCGENVSCTADCTSRFGDGSCASYGPDNCS